MQGLIKLESGLYIFRTDHHHEKAVWVWDIYKLLDGDSCPCHKWKKFPKHRNIKWVEYFNLDSPPKTMRYLPILGE